MKIAAVLLSLLIIGAFSNLGNRLAWVAPGKTGRLDRLAIPDGSPSASYPPPPTQQAPDGYYPTWAAYDCAGVAWIHITWTDPPAQVTPFDSVNRGWLMVDKSIGGYSYRWDYYWYDSINGHSVFNWATYYNRPDEPYYLSGWVHSTNGGDYWIYPDKLYPPCLAGDIFIPLLRR